MCCFRRLVLPKKNSKGESVELVLTSECADTTKRYQSSSDSCVKAWVTFISSSLPLLCKTIVHVIKILINRFFLETKVLSCWTNERRTSSYFPWFWQSNARLLSCLATSGWSFPRTFTLISRALLQSGSASLYFPLLPYNTARLFRVAATCSRHTQPIKYIVYSSKRNKPIRNQQVDQ